MSPAAVLRRLAVLGVLVVAWLVGAVGPASAHPALVSSSPAAGYAITDPPREITLAFTEPVTLPDRPLVVTNAQGDPVAPRVTTTPEGAGLVATPDVPFRSAGTRWRTGSSAGTAT